MLNCFRNPSISLSFNILKYKNLRNFQVRLFAFFILSILGPINSMGAATQADIESRTVARFATPSRTVKDPGSEAMLRSNTRRRGAPWLLKAAGVMAVAVIATTQGTDSNLHGLVALPNLGFPGAYAAEVPMGAGEATATVSPFAQAGHIATWVDAKGEMKRDMPLGTFPSVQNGAVLENEEQPSTHKQPTSFNLFQQITTNHNKAALAALEADANKGDPLAQGYLSIIYNERYTDDNKYKAELYAGKSIEQLKEMAAKGIAQAQWLLGKMYVQGLGTAVDKEGASRWTQASAMQEFAPALLDLADYESHTNGLKLFGAVKLGLTQASIDSSIKIQLYERAAAQNYTPAQTFLGTIYRDGYGVEQNTTKSIEWLTLAAEQNETASQYFLGLMYDKRGNYTEAMEWYKRGAEQGHGWSKYQIGDMYLEGKGVPKDAKEALKWFIGMDTIEEEGSRPDLDAVGDPIVNMALEGDLEALNWIKAKAEKGDKRQQYFLGIANLGGKVLPKNKPEGFRWLRLAALGGHEHSAKLLGDLYLGEELNKEAHTWYRLAADKDDKESQYMLGMLYLKGIGVDKSEEASFYWFRRAASVHPYASEWGDAKAQYMVGQAYLEGRWARQDPKEAAQWIQWSAKRGYAEAQALLGHLYTIGKGVPFNQDEAEKWFKLAASKGNEFARARLEELQNKSIVMETAKNIGGSLVVFLSLWVKCLTMR